MAQQLSKLTLSISVTKGEKGCRITMISSLATWSVRRSFVEINELHLILDNKPQCRGIYLPSLPDVISSTSSTYQKYLSQIITRIFWCKFDCILEFIQAPLQIRRVINSMFENEKNIPIKCGKLKKEGQKNKSYSKRYFVVLSNWLIQYWDSIKSFQESINNNNKNKKKNNNNKYPKGNIDLITVNAIISDNISKKYTFHLSTPNRIWKIQCKSDQEKKEWVQFLNDYLKSKQYQAFIAPHRPQNSVPS